MEIPKQLKLLLGLWFPFSAFSLVVSRCRCTPNREGWSGAEFHGLCLPLGYQDPYTQWMDICQAGKDGAQLSSKVIPLGVWTSRKDELKYRVLVWQ